MGSMENEFPEDRTPTTYNQIQDLFRSSRRGTFHSSIVDSLLDDGVTLDNRSKAYHAGEMSRENTNVFRSQGVRAGKRMFQ